MNNPFEILDARLSNIENLLLDIKHAPKETPTQSEYDRIDKIDEACKITGFSKSKIYKLTSQKEIPFKLRGNRLVFSRKELLAWLESKTIEPVKSNNNVLNSIAESAGKKERTAR